MAINILVMDLYNRFDLFENNLICLETCLFRNSAQLHDPGYINTMYLATICVRKVHTNRVEVTRTVKKPPNPTRLPWDRTRVVSVGG